MSGTPKKAIILRTKVRIQPRCKEAFADWQAHLNMVISSFPGFISLEILSFPGSSESEWVINQRFSSFEDGLAWRKSQERNELIGALKSFLMGEEADALQEAEVEVNSLQRGVTEVFITQVCPGKEESFRDWMAKVHRVEAKFPGFVGVYVQAPSSGQGKNWITLLQFDSSENLDRWLGSPERQEVLKESESLIESSDNQRVISPYAGWFSSVVEKGGAPAVWKEAMLVLLLLYPIVILERRFFGELAHMIGRPLAIFVGNTISVLLISWPLMPITIRCLRWWLVPGLGKGNKTLLGTGVVIALYILEVGIFWDFFS
ncbi:MAG: antibiotic biosynthesis monooxygenase [Verrucomicrobia bacterium]|nr:antibiotic biosynthesis monooxygenase [Verrucomicrobiota bacterium]